jgi:hypothetical protein
MRAACLRPSRLASQAEAVGRRAGGDFLFRRAELADGNNDNADIAVKRPLLPKLLSLIANSPTSSTR